VHQLFAQPQALWLLLGLPVLGLVGVFAWRRRRRAMTRWGSRTALETMLLARGRWRWLRATGRLAGLTLLVVAIAGPRWGYDLNSALAKGRDVVVVLDVSRSMLAQDVLGKSSLNRLGRARDALLDLTDSIEQRGGHRVGLVIFATRPWVVCPLTQDYDHFRESIAHLEPADFYVETGPGPEESPSGTRIGAALQFAAEKIHDPRFRGNQDILLLSDGDDPAHDEEWRIGIKTAKDLAIPVHTVGIGDPERGSPIPLVGETYLLHEGKSVLTRLEEKPLEEIARQTGGVYTPARTQAFSLAEIFRERIESRPAREDLDDQLPVYQQHSSWFFGAALVFLAVDMSVGGRARRPRRERSASLPRPMDRHQQATEKPQ
jgi:Ca-activated chloride channel family protein